MKTKTEIQEWVCLGRRDATDGGVFQFWVVLAAGRLTSTEIPFKKPLCKNALPGDVYRVTVLGLTRVSLKGRTKPTKIRVWENKQELDAWRRADVTVSREPAENAALLEALAPLKKVYDGLDPRARIALKVLILEHLETPP